MEVTDLYRSKDGAATLTDRRVAAGLNQADIAEALGVTRAAVSQWERGVRPVPARHRPTYGRLLGIGDSDDAFWATANGAASRSAQHSQATPAAPVVLPDAVETGDAPTPRARRGVRGVAARAAHLIVVTDLRFSGNAFLGDERPKQWRVYSPQGLEVDKTSAPNLEQLLDEGVVRLSRLGYRQLYIHHEQRIVIDDEPVRVIRHQTSPPSDARLHQTRVFLSHFTPEFYLASVGEDLAEKARIRKDFERIFPQSATDEMLFVVAEPTDYYGWLQDQTLPYVPYTIVSHLPEAKRPFFAAVHHDHSSVRTNVGLIPFDDLGIDRDTTIGEIAEKLERYASRQPCRAD